MAKHQSKSFEEKIKEKCCAKIFKYKKYFFVIITIYLISTFG